MNYADIVNQNYPAYRLTRIGSGNTYEELEWSTSNPLPNPIPKATLDADINEYTVNGWAGAVGELGDTQSKELIALAQLSDSSGLIYKVGHRKYKLDASSYLTSITSANITDALGYTPYSDANPNLYTTKSYVDNLAASGITWIEPVELLNLIGGTNTPPTAPVTGDAYIIYTAGNTGAWSTFNVGDLVQYKAAGWALITDVSSITVGMRYIIGASTTTTAVGFAAGKDNQLAVITGGVGGAGENITWSFVPAVDNNAVFIINSQGEFFGNSYLYDLATDTWMLFQSSHTYTAGDGMTLVGTTFNVAAGPGAIINNDAIAIDYFNTGGIFTTEDGTTASTAPTAQLSLTKTGITPGNYNIVTVDAHGRITAGVNPTTLAGHGIIDAQPLDADLTSIAGIAGTSGFLKKTGPGAWALDTVTGVVTNVSVITANGLAGTVATATTTPEITLSTTVTGMLKGNGTAISAAVAGSDFVVPTVGGGVAVRQISTVVPPISGTSNKADANTSPVITDGTQIWSQSIIPRATTSSFTIDGSFYIDHNTNNRRIVVAIWRTVAGVNTLVGVSSAFITASNNGGEIAISFYDSPVTTSAVTYSLRSFANGAGIWYVAQGATPVFNGNLGKQIIRLTETS